jgi:hypothetical protein
MATNEITTQATRTTCRRARTWVAVVCVLGGLLAMAAAPALAQQFHPFDSEFTGADTPAGFIGQAGKVDITTASGDVYVSDNARNRVYRFDSAGAFQSQITGFDFSSANGIAVDNSGTGTDGDLVVNDATGVHVYDDAGAHQFDLDPTTVPNDTLGDHCGVAVGGDGSIYVSDGSNQLINKFDSAGTFDTQLTSLGFSPCALDVAPGGDIYALEFCCSGVHRLSSTGTPVSVLPPTCCPSSVTVDDTTSHVFIDEGGIVNEYDTSDALVSGTSNHLEGSQGAVSDPATGKIYASSNPGDGARVVVFGPTATFPDVTTGAASQITDTTAHLDGTINPDGVNADYQFEYGTDTSYGSVAPAAPVAAGNGSSDVAASADPTGLTPGTTYHFRLNGTNVNGTVNGGDSTFTTFAAPTITNVHTLDVTTATGTVGATITPGFDPDATYHIEFGTTNAYGSTTPDANLADANDPEDIQVQLNGLSPNTTYHYKVVASNVIDTVDSPDRTFTTYGPAGAVNLPDGRAYEKVSPADKNGSDILNAGTIAADDGNRVSYMSFAAFADVPGGGLVDQYFAARGANGWSSKGISPLQAPVNSLNSSLPQHVNSDVTQALIMNGNPPLDGAAPDTTNLYRFDGTTYHLVTPNEPFSGGGLGPPAPTFDGASTGYSHIIFEQPEALTNDATGVGTIYDFTGGQLEIVSRDNNDAANTTSASTGGLRTAVSKDGTRVFFGQDSEVWVRKNLSDTDHVSADQRTTPDPDGTAGKTFAGATSNGSDAYFTSTQKLTDDATSSITNNTADLYRYNVDTGTLTDVTVDNGDPNGADVQSVLGVGAGPTVYFVARGVLDGGATAGKMNLYGQRGGTLKFIATLDDSFGDTSNWDVNEVSRTSRTSENGRYLLFSTIAPQGSFDNNGHREFYRFDYDTSALNCVSCNPAGTAPTRDAALTSVEPFLQVMNVSVRRNLLEDGTVYFISEDKLVPADSNNRFDVYQWKGGSPQLISTGQSNADAEFLGASASGNDVFFLTRQQLVGSDQDNEVDVYDARVGGGFPEQQTPPPCQGDACKGPVSSPPNAADAGTAFFTSVGNTEATGDLTFRVASISSAAKKKFAKTGKLTIKVSVTDAAAIDARMVARIGKRNRVMGSKTASASRAGTVNITFTLTKAARTELRRKKKLKVTITVNVLDAGSKRTTMTLRRAK